jgi:hypothetical protein
MKYEKGYLEYRYVTYRHIFRDRHRSWICTTVPLSTISRFNLKRRIVADWKRCYREKRNPDWNRGDDA